MTRREFRDKTVLITGGAGGIGRELARCFAAEGARIVLVDVDESAVRTVADELKDARAIVCDITDFPLCEKLLGDLSIDVLVNNAGVTHRSAFASTDPAVLQKVIEVNLFGAMNCTKALLSNLRERKGLIVVMSSVAGLGPLDARSAYSASKHALHGMFETLRCELSDSGVDVLMVCPSFVATGIATTNLAEERGRPGRSVSTVGRVLQPERVAELIVRAAKRSRRLLLPTWTARFAYLLSRLTPRFYERKMSAGVREELDGGGR